MAIVNMKKDFDCVLSIQFVVTVNDRVLARDLFDNCAEVG